ncbi:hypothetical protein FUAX_24710 [Fulvitalea axinellae]|uniref:Anti-sigma factor antagonist n=1 Tax=Fulvitalea axinellae TaxID=1182444 RepID=A0AAU9D696_9BACT|nr:hypothetical protein FUAX_24710 [Fulvitalea axinellae]
MKYSIEKKEQYVLIKPEFEKLDSTKSPAMKSDVLTFRAEGARNVILDLSDVKYVDSSGLSALLVGHRVFNEDNGMFVITGSGEHVLKLIKISQLDSVLHILPTVEEAIDAVFLHEIERDLTDTEE